VNPDAAEVKPSGPDPRCPRCPFCGSAATELLSLFGSQLLTEQYYCRTCRTPFEYIKDMETDAETVTTARQTAPDGAGLPGE
jgi:hypothetical protein